MDLLTLRFMEVHVASRILEKHKLQLEHLIPDNCGHGSAAAKLKTDLITRLTRMLSIVDPEQLSLDRSPRDRQCQKT